MKYTLALSLLLSSILTLPVLAQDAAEGAPTPSEHTPSEHLVDLSRSHWCYDCTVDILDKYKVMQGFSDHTFRGDRPINRYELASAVLKTHKHLLRQQGRSLAYPEQDFPQVLLRDNHWARQDVIELISYRGLLSDWAQDFEGTEVASREDLAYALSELIRVYKAQSGSLAPAADRISDLGIDLPQRSPHYTAIQQVLNQQLMSLYGDHTFRAHQSVTRYALAASLCKLFEQVR